MHQQFRSTRRQILLGIAGAAVASVVPSAQCAEQRSLKALAGEKGILFGSAVGAGASGTLTGSLADARYLSILREECAVLVPENELKSYVIAAEQRGHNFEPADRIANFASTNAMKLRGHTLLWNRTEYTPKWLGQWLSTQSAIDAERYLRDYIQRVCARYRQQIYSWDVVNETIDPKTGAVRDTAFTRALGFESLRIAFEAAREHAPGTQLVYNDYMSWEAGNEKHCAGVLKLLERFKREGVPVDALGIQSHIGNDGHIHKAQRQQWTKFVDEAIGMGYSLLITEFDVNDKDLPTDIKLRDSQIATAAKEYLDVMLSYKQLDQVLCWGMVDHYSWLQGFSPRSDGLPQRPTPYDDTFKVKPLRDAIAAAFESAPARPARQS
jgi:endo-1,4-beta-xylanase